MISITLSVSTLSVSIFFNSIGGSAMHQEKLVKTFCTEQSVSPSSGSFIVGIEWPFVFCSLSKKSDVEAICPTPSYDLFFTIDFGGN